MKIIFLDVDGVLNYHKAPDRIGSYLGIMDKNVENLKKIIDATDAKLILCSSWKDEWHGNKEPDTLLGKYLVAKLKAHGLHIEGKTRDNGRNRGEGIANWLEDHSDVEAWVVLDDTIFRDYRKYGVMEHLVRTDNYHFGLTEEKAEEAIGFLENSIKPQSD